MIECAQCKFEIRDDTLGRVPPWCPGCGCDLKVARGEAPATPSAEAPPPDISSAQPAPTAGASLDTWIGHPREESLQETIARVIVSQEQAQKCGTPNEIVAHTAPATPPLGEVIRELRQIRSERIAAAEQHAADGLLTGEPPTAIQPRSPKPLATPAIAAPAPEPQQRKCPFCAEAILADAKKCKHCGEWLDEPADSPRTQTQNPVPVLIEQTSKTYKAIILASVVGVFAGLAMACGGQFAAGATVAFTSFAVFLYGKVAAWWHHG